MSESNVTVMNERALAFIDHGDMKAAKALYEEISQLDSNDAESRMMRGVIQAEMGDIVGAENLLRQALVLRPDCPDTLFYLGNVLKAKGRLAEAVDVLVAAIDLDADFSDARKLLRSIHMNYANSLLQQERLDEAVACFETMNRLESEQAPVWFMLGRTQAQQRKYSVAELSMREAIRINPDFTEAHFVLASFLLMQGLTEKACAHSDRAVELDPENIDAIAMSANIAKRMEDPQKAYNLLSPILTEGAKQINIALAFAMISRDVGKQQEAITLLENILSSDSSLLSASRSNLHFNLGRLYDDIKNYDQAFVHYKEGNDLKPSSFNRDQHKLDIEAQIAIFTPEFMQELPRSTLCSERPIFIVGMVRSGTSLVEQILASHPDIYGAGELADIYQFTKNLPEYIGTDETYPACLAGLAQSHCDSLAQSYLDLLDKLSADTKYVTDKMPSNFLYLGLIESLFPNARIIHCMRNPIDTCLSTYFQDFSSDHPYAYDLPNLAAFYQDYLKSMAHWRQVIKLPMLEVSYEDLVEDQEKVSRSLIDFCDLPWSDSCLQFHENKRFVRTASFDQVNRAIYKQSVARWKNYESHLGPLIEVLNN